MRRRRASRRAGRPVLDSRSADFMGGESKRELPQPRLDGGRTRPQLRVTRCRCVAGADAIGAEDLAGRLLGSVWWSRQSCAMSSPRPCNQGERGWGVRG